MRVRTYPITRLNDGRDIVVVVGLLLSGSLQTLHWPDLLIQLALYDSQLPCQLQGVDVEEFDFFGVFGVYRCRW